MADPTQKWMSMEQWQELHDQATFVLNYLATVEPYKPVSMRAVRPSHSAGFVAWSRLSEADKYLFFCCAMAGASRAAVEHEALRSGLGEVASDG